MIRNVVLAKLRPGYDADEVRDVADGLRSLDPPGIVNYTVGLDCGLREGNWDFVIVADFIDAQAYRTYDADEPHNALRDRLAPFVERIARAQFEVPD